MLNGPDNSGINTPKTKEVKPKVKNKTGRQKSYGHSFLDTMLPLHPARRGEFLSPRDVLNNVVGSLTQLVESISRRRNGKVMPVDNSSDVRTKQSRESNQKDKPKEINIENNNVINLSEDSRSKILQRITALNEFTNSFGIKWKEIIKQYNPINRFVKAIRENVGFGLLTNKYIVDQFTDLSTVYNAIRLKILVVGEHVDPSLQELVGIANSDTRELSGNDLIRERNLVRTNLVNFLDRISKTDPNSINSSGSENHADTPISVDLNQGISLIGLTNHINEHLEKYKVKKLKVDYLIEKVQNDPKLRKYLDEFISNIRVVLPRKNDLEADLSNYSTITFGELINKMEDLDYQDLQNGLDRLSSFLFQEWLNLKYPDNKILYVNKKPFMQHDHLYRNWFKDASHVGKNLAFAIARSNGKLDTMAVVVLVKSSKQNGSAEKFIDLL